MSTFYCPKCGQAFSADVRFCPNDGTSRSDAQRQARTILQAEPSKKFGPGSQVGEYIIEKKLGAGGMGEVWSGKQPQIGKRVAIKLLHRKLAESKQAVTRFMQEARAVNEIGHPNIVDIFSFGELPDGRPYFVMEHLNGVSLADHMKHQGPLPGSEILNLLEQLCAALGAGHERGIIHRDLKPDNLFLVTRGASHFLKILDFGIAKMDSNPGESLTNTGAMMGTPAYMSPEQCEGSKEVDHRTDLYALGIILFEMLTGRTPFREPGEGSGVILSKQIFVQAPLPSSMVSGRTLPAEIDAFVTKALSKKASERPTDCLVFLSELKAAAASLASETKETIQGAKPFYDSTRDISEPLKKLSTSELSKKLPSNLDLASSLASQASDYYSGSASIANEPSPKRRLAAIAGGALATVLAAGVLLLGSFSQAAPSQASPALPVSVAAAPKEPEKKAPDVIAPVSIPFESKSLTPISQAPVSQPASQPKTPRVKKLLEEKAAPVTAPLEVPEFKVEPPADLKPIKVISTIFGG